MKLHFLKLSEKDFLRRVCRYDSACHYSEAGRDIFINIFSEDNKKQLLLLQTLFEIEQKDNAISQFQKDKKINSIITIAAILIIILLISLIQITLKNKNRGIKNPILN